MKNTIDIKPCDMDIILSSNFDDPSHNYEIDLINESDIEQLLEITREDFILNSLSNNQYHLKESDIYFDGNDKAGLVLRDNDIPIGYIKIKRLYDNCFYTSYEFLSGGYRGHKIYYILLNFIANQIKPGDDWITRSAVERNREPYHLKIGHFYKDSNNGHSQIFYRDIDKILSIPVENYNVITDFNIYDLEPTDPEGAKTYFD